MHYLYVFIILIAILGAEPAQCKDVNTWDELKWATIKATRQFSNEPELPVKVGVRDSLWFGGMVFQIKNTSTTTLDCTLVVLNHSAKQMEAVKFSLPPNKIQEIGMLEMGWKFEDGEEIVVMCDGYKLGFWKI